MTLFNASVAFIVYPLFVSNTIMLYATGTLLSAGLYIFQRSIKERD